MDFEVGLGPRRLRTLDLLGFVSLNKDFLPKALMMLFALESVLSDFTLAAPAFLKSEFAYYLFPPIHSGLSVSTRSITSHKQSAASPRLFISSEQLS